MDDKARHEQEAAFEEAKYATLIPILVGPVRTLELAKRVPELFKARGWPLDQDLLAVVMAAIACRKLRAGRQLFRRPDAAGGCGGKWPESDARLTAIQIVDALELVDLMEAR